MSVDDPEHERRQLAARMTAEDRIRFALELGRRELEALMAATGMDRDAALRELKRRRHDGRVPSKCKDG